MLRGLRNPFRLRRAESIDTDDAFLTLFEPGILEVLPQRGLLDTVHIIRSAAGGGKTSLIRMFTPASLITLTRRAERNDPKTRELHQRMREFGAIDDNGPAVMGVLLTCGPGYSMLQDLGIDQARKNMMFFGLLNARITLAILRAMLEFKELDFHDGLSRIIINSSKQASALKSIVFPCTGRQLYEWAEQREATLCESLDSIGPLSPEKLPGDDALYSLKLFESDNASLDDIPIAKNVLLMMDDVHKLTTDQRDLLLTTIIEARSRIGVWIAERFEALSPEEMLSSGAEKGRDYGSTIEIENYWRGKHDKFEKLAMKVATRRVEEASDTEISTFGSCLQESLVGQVWDDRFIEIVKIVSTRVKAKPGANDRFRDWIRLRDSAKGTPQRRANEWRALEILIERELNKKQRGLFDDQPLDEEELAQKDDSSLANAAELFLANEFKLPYYFGTDRLARLASLNIQQFLGLAGEVFEEATAAELLRNTAALPAVRQHAIMKQMAKQLWEEIPRKVRHGRELRQFLESVGKFANAYTYRPTAPNDPGVTGTAIRMSERTQLFYEASQPSLKANIGMVRLGEMIASALSHNLLVAQLDYNCKKEKWMVLNLNRLLCVHFDLPLGYGLYKERPLKTLMHWLDKPFFEPERELL